MKVGTIALPGLLATPTPSRPPSRRAFEDLLERSQDRRDAVLQQRGSPKGATGKQDQGQHAVPKSADAHGDQAPRPEAKPEGSPASGARFDTVTRSPQPGASLPAGSSLQAPGGASLEADVSGDRVGDDASTKEVQQAAQHRAFALDELGVFGGSAAISPLADTQVDSGAAAPASAAGDGENPSSRPEPLVPDPAGPLEGGAAPSREPRPTEAETGGLANPPSLSSEGPAITAGPPSASSQEDVVGSDPFKEIGGASHLPGATGRAQPKFTKPPVNVVVSDQDGIAHVSMVSPGITPESRARLRKIVTDILSEHGMTLADLSLNGNPVENAQSNT